MTQESSHDQTYYGLEYLQQDLVDVMEKLVPQCTVEGQYRHPGPKHIDFAMNEAKEVGAWTSLNTDAHLRSVFFGRSETVVIVDGALDLGEFGYVYFVDWDQIRDRHRVVQVQIMGSDRTGQMSDVFLGIDLGTTGVRCVAFDSTLGVLASEYVESSPTVVGAL